MIKQQIAWFTTIFAFSLAAGLLAGRSVRAAFQVPPTQEPTVTAVEEWVYAQPAPPASVDDLLAPAQAPAPVIEPAGETEPSALPEAGQAISQQNVLLVQVDQLQSPRLESIWLAIYVPKMSRVMVLPVYPLVEQNGAFAEQMRQAGSLTSVVDPYGKISAELYGLLKAIGLEWHHYLLLDRAALVGIVDSVAGPEAPASLAGMPALDAALVVASIASAQENPQAYSLAQAWLYGEICSRLAHPSVPAEQLQKLDEIFSAGLLSDIDFKTQAGFLETARQAGGLKCEFPSLGQTP